MSTVALLSPRDFFRTQVCDASKALNLELNQEVEFYVVNLLCDFINPEHLTIDKELNVLDTPLALMLKKAFESGPDTQIKVLKRLGDTSLYFAGYFQDYFNRKTFDVGYYIDMGTNAYEQTSHLLRSHKNDTHFAQVYALLSQEFRKLVTILTEVAENLFASRSQDVLETYVKWQQTQSEKLRKILEEKGVQPVFLGPKVIQ